MLSGPRIATVFAVTLGALVFGVPSAPAKIPDGTYTFNSTIRADSTWQFVLSTIDVAGDKLTTNVDYHNVSAEDQDITGEFVDGKQRHVAGAAEARVRNDE